MARIGKAIATLLTYDFCPWANKWVYWLKKPGASLSAVAVASLACALFVRIEGFVGFAAVLAVVLLGYAWPSISIRGLHARITFRQRRGSESETVVAVVSVENRWPWPVWGLSVEGGFGPASLALARVAGRSTTEFEWEFRPSCRGRYPLAVPYLVTGFPFGLRHAQRPVEIPEPLIVWPAIIPLDTLLDAAETRPSDDYFSDHRAGDSGDMTGVRPFRAGDSLRRVHWAQTARHGTIIVCERQAPVQSSVRVVFDSDLRLHRGEGTNGSLEWSIRIAASVASAYHRENAPVEFCFGHETWQVPLGAIGWQMFMDRLASWSPCHHHHAADDCDHEHSHNACHRIHHHHCGAFQITVTTDIGAEHRTEHRHVHGDNRLIVLKTAAFDEPCDDCGHEHSPLPHGAIVLHQLENVAADFRTRWRQVCHVG